MPIRPFLPDSHSFDPEDIANMSAAFEAALGKLGLVDRTDPATMAVAKLVIAFAKAGHRIPSGCAPWHCSNYQSKPPQEPLARPTCFQVGALHPKSRHNTQEGSRNPVLSAEVGRGSRIARMREKACSAAGSMSRIAEFVGTPR